MSFCLNYQIVILYGFVDIETYVGDEPPQQDEEMEEEVVEVPIGHGPIISCRLDCRVCIELADHICALFAKEGVLCAHVRDIRREPHLFDIWGTLPCDMMTLMCHVVGVLTLIQSLCASAQSKSSPQDELHGDAHHDS